MISACHQTDDLSSECVVLLQQNVDLVPSSQTIVIFVDHGREYYHVSQLLDSKQQALCAAPPGLKILFSWVPTAYAVGSVISRLRRLTIAVRIYRRHVDDQSVERHGAEHLSTS